MLGVMARRSNRPDDLGNFDARPFIAAFQRLDRRTQVVLLCVLAVVGVVALAAYVVSQRHRSPEAGRPPGPTQPQTAPSGQPPTRGPASTDPGENLLLGNPSGATPDPANRDNYLHVKPYFTLSYNDTKGTPNWVSWRVTSADLGTADRKRQFDTDYTLPRGFRLVTSLDYKDSGFDRGHMCPHSDRAASTAMSFGTFVMTNIVPQSPNANQKAWRELEDYGRDLIAKQGMRLYTVCGPAGRGGRGKFGPAETVGKNQVVVPAECWKVMVAVPETGGPGDPAAIGPTARVITVVMPNDDEQVTSDAWAGYRTSPAEVERRTGYRFFDRLPPATADALRRKVDAAYVEPPKPKKYGGASRDD
jgi:endonuclease G